MTKLIALDDGHGKETPGKRTPPFPEDGYVMKENEFNSAVVAYLKTELERCGFRTILVAPGDNDVPLAQRCATANKAKADFYVSIHANANTGKWGDWGGIETYAWTSGESLRVGKIVQKHLIADTGLGDRGVKDGTWLYVLKNTSMPAILCECGYMDNLKEARLLRTESYRKTCAAAIAKGLCEAFGVKYVPDQKANTNGTKDQPSPKPVANTKSPILGREQATLDQMVAFVKKVNPNFNPEIAKAFLEVGDVYGVRGDVAFCQSILETNWFRFGGDVSPSQNNFAGIGATGGGAKGNSFSSIRDGVTAQIQHLFAYASKNKIPDGEKLLDPRFNMVTRGVAPYWEDLGGRWAVPGYDKTKYSSFEEAYNAGATYGQNILRLYADLLAVAVPASQPKKSFRQLGLEFLQQEYGVSKNWKPTDPVDFGILGSILERVKNKGGF